jgi:hypothetical protein
MKSAITDLPLIDGRPMTPEEEVRFWRYFYTESQRLFGDKEAGTLESLTAKAMKLLRYDARDVAQLGKACYEHCDESRREEWRATFDARKQMEWKKKQYVPVYLEHAWLIYTRRSDRPELRLSKEDAIRQIAKEYRFPSYEAAYKELQRLGIKGLPSTWPK